MIGPHDGGPCDHCPFGPDWDPSAYFIRFGSGARTAEEFAAIPDSAWRCHETTPQVQSTEGKPCVGLALMKRQLQEVPA